MTDKATLMENAAYCPAFCEENIWHLLGALEQAGVPGRAVMVSNACKSVPYFHQRAAPESYLCWDYHVFAISVDTVLDLDHRDCQPLAVADYLAASFPAAETWPEELRPRLLTFYGVDYRSRFASDRRHMRQGDGWSATPPTWPCIGEGHTLTELLQETRERGCPLQEWP